MGSVHGTHRVGSQNGKKNGAGRGGGSRDRTRGQQPRADTDVEEYDY
jgi:hypothetical protein